MTEIRYLNLLPFARLFAPDVPTFKFLFEFLSIISSGTYSVSLSLTVGSQC